MSRRKPSEPCAACGDFFPSCDCIRCADPSVYYKPHHYCDGCKDEIEKGVIPTVTSSRLRPSGEGQIPRQRYGRTKTDS